MLRFVVLQNCASRSLLIQVSPCRAEGIEHCTFPELPAEHNRLSDFAERWRSRPDVRGQQRLHPVIGSAGHQSGASYSKTTRRVAQWWCPHLIRLLVSPAVSPCSIGAMGINATSARNVYIFPVVTLGPDCKYKLMGEVWLSVILVPGGGVEN